MAKKAKKIVSKKEKKDLNLLSFDKKDLLSSPQSYRSLFFGVATVIILFLVGFGLTRLFLGSPTPEISEEAVSTKNIEDALNNKENYRVQNGDTLWSIAEEKYGSGFEWYKIAEANNIVDTTILEDGTILIIPGLEEVAVDDTAMVNEEMVETSTPTPTQTQAVNENMASRVAEKITGDSYIIQPGDDLWDIAVRAYGDGYKWGDIARANNLDNPDLIHSDNKLVLPR